MFEKEIDFMKKAHGDTMRKHSNVLYYNHPLDVFHLLEKCNFDYRLNYNMYASSLLHDVVEDTSFTIEDIKNNFNEEIAFIVDLLTNKEDSKLFFSKDLYMLKLIDNEIALTIKIADRICNSLDFYNAEETKNYASKYFHKANFLFACFYNNFIVQNNFNILHNAECYKNLYNKILTVNTILKK